jgi:protein-disulfide isomerase
VKFVTRNFPISQIHPNAQKAVEAAECAADQGQSWPYHDMLFEHRDALDVESLTEYAGDLGMDQEEFGLCLTSGEEAAIIQADMDAGLSYGVDGAPTFFINGRKLEGLVPFEIMGKLIEQAEQEAGRIP